MNPTEIAEQSESGEYISEHAQHWCVESFIPVPSCDLREFLAEKLTSPGQRQWFLEACDRIARWTREQSLRLHEKFDTAYAALDPDRDTSLILTRSLEHYEQSATDVDQLMRQAVAAANYVEISREELEQACLISSLWGVPLHVDLKIFRHLAVFARGDIMGVRQLRRWKKFYRQELVDVEIYRRVVVLFQIKPEVRIDGDTQHDRLYLRMFKNIPQADVEMLLPGTKIRFRWTDHTKILIPSLGGFGMSLWRVLRTLLFLAVVATSKVMAIIGLIGVIITYSIRGFTNYFNAKKRHELNLTRSLYFQKLDSNAGVIYRILEEGQQQQFCAAILVCFVLLAAGTPLHSGKLKRRCERFVRENMQVEIAFALDQPLHVLKELGIVQQSSQADSWELVLPRTSPASATLPSMS